MTDITLTCANYVRQMPLVSGEVGMAGGTLRLRLSQGGSWPSRAAMLRDALTDPSVAGGEASMGVHLNRIDRGDRSFVALPIFVLRNFTARDLFVRQGSPLTRLEQLAGKRIGMYSWTASGSIWYRHLLAWAGLDPLALRWSIGEIDKAYAPRIDATLPDGVARASRPLSEMLIDGELDAIYSPSLPLRYDAARGSIVRLLPDYRSTELRYFKETGVFPPQHLVVLRREVWEAERSLARRVTDAFVQCEAAVTDSLRGFPYASPWFEAEQEQSAAEIGVGIYRHGLEENRAALQQFAATAHRLGLTSREVAVDDYFAEYLAS